MMIVVVFPRPDEELLLDGEEVGDGEDVDVLWCFEEDEEDMMRGGKGVEKKESGYKGATENIEFRKAQWLLVDTSEKLWRI